MGAGVAVGVASFETIDTERHEFSSGKAPGMKRHTSTRQATGRHQTACGCWNYFSIHCRTGALPTFPLQEAHNRRSTSDRAWVSFLFSRHPTF